MYPGRGDVSPLKVVQYLLERGLIDPVDLFDGAVTVIDMARRNRNLAVLRERHPCYFVKQAVDDDERRTLVHEERVYRLLGEHPRTLELSPRSFGFDDEQGILTLEYVRGAHNLSEHSQRTARFSILIAKRLGEALLRIHDTAQSMSEEDRRVLALGPPWILRAHRPSLDDYVRMSSGAIETVRIIQQSEIIAHAFDNCTTVGRSTHWCTLT